MAATDGLRIEFADFADILRVQDVEGLVDDLDNKAPLNHLHQRVHIVDFAHEHTKTEVIGLDLDLAAKAPAVHSHAVDNVTGLQAELDGKADTLHDHNSAYAPIEHTVDIEKHIQAGERSAWNSKADGGALITHSIDGVKHITAAERSLWNSKAEGMHMHAISEIDGLLDALSNSGAPTLEKILYGVSQINPLATLHQQVPAIVSHVSTRNRAATPFASANDIVVADAATASLTTSTTVAHGFGRAKLSNGLILIVAQSSGTAYSLYLHNPATGTTVPAGTATVPGIGGTPGVAPMPNGKALIVVYASSTAYNLYLYDPVANSATPAGTASLTVSTGGLAFGAAALLLPNGQVLIVVYASNSAYNLYLYDPVANSAVPAGTASLIATASSGAGIALSMLPSGKVLVVLRDSVNTMYRFCTYDPVENTAEQFSTVPVETTGIPTAAYLPDGNTMILAKASSSVCRIFCHDHETNVLSEGPSVGASAQTFQPAAILMPNGRVLIVVPTTAYVFFIYDHSTASLLSAGLPSVAATSIGAVMLMNTWSGRLMAMHRNTTTAYKLLSVDGPFGSSNRYQFPVEIHV